VAEPRRTVESAPGGADFARDVVRCIVSLSDEGPAAGPLSLPFGLTAWMHRHGAGVSDTIDTLMSLRTALLVAAGLDAGSEPVPLRVADPVLFVLNLAVYLDGLVERAARVLGVSRGDAADAAVELLGSS
jgi:hypothetical protein